MKEYRNQKPTDSGALGASNLAFLLWDNAFVIVLSVLLGLTLALAYLQWTKPVYAARARLEIAGSERVLPDFQRQSSEDIASASLLKTVEQTIASTPVLARVVAKNNLADDPELTPPGTDRTEGAVIERLRRRVSVNLIRGTRLIAVEVEAGSPEKAARWLQSLLDAFFSQSLDHRRKQSVSARDFLVGEADRLARKLHDTELRLQQYREKYDAMAIADRQNLIIDHLRQLHSQLSDARNTRLTLEPEQVQVKAALESGDLAELLNLKSIATRPEVAELRKQLDTQNGQVAAYALPYGDNHPILLQARRQRDETATMLNETAHSVAESILRNYQAAKSTEELLQQERTRQEQIAVELDRIAIPYHALERDLQSDTAMHAQILARLKETDVTQNLMAGPDFSDSYVHLLEAPFAPPEPVKPLWRLALATGLLGGGVFGLILTALRCAFDDSVPSVDAAETCLGVATLAVVPRSRQLGFRRGRVLPPAPGATDTEAFRLLRTALALREDATEQRAIMFTSACPGEGKTCCSINYAAVVAQSGLRTLLIDGDLRRPKLRTAFERYVKKTSLAECLADPDRLGSAIDSTGQQNLFLLGSPHGTPRAAELLAGDNLRILLERCAGLFDRIVIDTAPVAVVSDALCFARYVPTICLVVHAGHTPRRLVRRAHTLITEIAGREITGVILNQIRRDRAVNYGYYVPSRYTGKLATA
jgi:succinoglycan biosynthesis transport protein ExoP